MKEINKWLDEGDALLASFSLHGTNENIQGQLDKQKVYFLSFFNTFMSSSFLEFLSCCLSSFLNAFLCVFFGPMFSFPFDLFCQEKKRFGFRVHKHFNPMNCGFIFCKVVFWCLCQPFYNYNRQSLILFSYVSP